MKLWVPILAAVVFGALFIGCSGSTGMQLTPPVTTSVSSLFDSATLPTQQTSAPMSDDGIFDPTPGTLETPTPTPSPSPGPSASPDDCDPILCL